MQPFPQHLARLAGRETDRLDHETIEFHRRVFAGYEAMAASGDPRFERLDAAAAPQEVLDAALARLRGLEHPLLSAL